MNILKKAYKNVAARIYRSLQSAHSERSRVLYEKHLNNVCVRGEKVIIDKEANIQNATGNSSNIIIGDNTWIRGHLMVFNHGGKIKIGNDCCIAQDTRIWSADSIIIGDRVLISHNVNIHDNSSHPLDAKQRHEDYIHIV